MQTTARVLRLRIVREIDSIGVGHTLWECKREFADR
jgi:hypothetical protein